MIVLPTLSSFKFIRKFNNADHRILIPGTMLTGLIGMLLCDIIAKKFLLPVNCITALLGVPVILWVIAKNLRIIK